MNVYGKTLKISVHVHASIPFLCHFVINCLKSHALKIIIELREKYNIHYQVSNFM